MPTPPLAPPQPKLLDRVRWHLRLKHYAICTEQVYIDWIRRYILFHRKRHPEEMDEEQIAEFLTYLAVEKHVAASTQNQALSARSSSTSRSSTETRLHRQGGASQTPT